MKVLAIAVLAVLTSLGSVHAQDGSRIQAQNADSVWTVLLNAPSGLDAFAVSVSPRITLRGAETSWQNVLVQPALGQASVLQQAERILVRGAESIWSDTLVYPASSVAFVMQSGERIIVRGAESVWAVPLGRPDFLPTPTPTPTPPPTATPTPPPTATGVGITTPTPTPAIPAAPVPTPTPFPGQEGVSIYLYMDKTVGIVGEDVPATLSVANSIAKPEMTVRLILKVPSGMSVSGSLFTEACAGQCLAVVKVGTGELRNIALNLRANQLGQFQVTGDLEWLFADQPGQVFRKIEVLAVQANPAAEASGERQIQTTAPGEASASKGGSGGWLVWLRNIGVALGAFSGLLGVICGIRRLITGR